jgi:SAM-dependent methyltransferase
MADLEKYREREMEKARTADLLRILPKNRHSVLDVGARDGHFTRLLIAYFKEVTALDLERPSFEIPGVVTVAGDATKLTFPNESFDCVFCAEVLEHIPDVRRACSELVRVARHEIIVGVPFRQDTRLGRTTCQSCGKVNPPWGHLHSFDEDKLCGLFPGMRAVSKSFVGTNRQATNSLATFFLDLAGNPWGTYNQDEPCIHCGATMVPPQRRKFWHKVCSAVGVRIEKIQALWTQPHGNWIHIVFSKNDI